MGYRDTKQALLTIAAGQGGYFTARQALSVGYAYPEQHYHSREGNWERMGRGIYRLTYYPEPNRPDLVILTLQSCDRTGRPQAIASHETALSIHELSDANPARWHFTVPPGFRRQMPPGAILYRAILAPGDWEEHEGYRVTTPLRTLLDAAASPAAWGFLVDAVYDALRRGLVMSKHLIAAQDRAGVGDEAKEWLRIALEAAKQRLARSIAGEG